MVADSGWHASPPPELEPAALRGLLESDWALTGTLERLYAERDLNYRLTTPTGSRWLVKLSHPDIGAERIALENRVLDRLSQDASAPTTPRPRATVSGALQLAVEGKGQLRVLEWLPGEALDSDNATAAQAFALGESCARLNRALAQLGADEPDLLDVARSVLPSDLPWDLRTLRQLAPLKAMGPDQAVAGLAMAVVDHFTDAVSPVLDALPRQLIHNDLNPDNLLVEASSAQALPAVIDFGDMVIAPVVCDLAIASAYFVEPGDAPLARTSDVVRGFLEEGALSPQERQLLPALIAGRLSQTVLIQGARVAAGDPSLERTYTTAAERLEALWPINQERLPELLRAL